MNSDPRDVADAVWRLTTGRVSRAYPELIPPPGALAAEILKSRNARLDDEAKSRPRLAPPADNRGDLTAEQRKQIVAELRAAGKIRTPGKEKGPTDAEHLAAIKRTIAEAQGIKTAELDAMIAALPDHQPATQRSAA